MADNYSLVKRASESNFDHHKRLVYGKLVDKTLADCDYSELAEALYGQPFAFEVGHKMEGNFYKCGDHTASPHWGSWVPMPRLDFHDPDSFGTFVITE